ncbi:MAG: hypothetical protein ACJA1Z_002558 [Patiriisocius sp.]
MENNSLFVAMKLIFVYNANSGALNSLMGTAHKIISPETYSCNLCALTFGNFKENTTWAAFRESSNLELVFLHKDEFLKQYRSKWLPKYDFPIILSQDNDGLYVFIDAKKLNALDDIEALIKTIEDTLRAIN